MLDLDKQIEALNIEVMHRSTEKQQNPYWYHKMYNKMLYVKLRAVTDFVGLSVIVERPVAGTKNKKTKK